MDLGTVLGVVGGFVVLYAAVLLEGSNIGMFMNLLATVVVFGGRPPWFSAATLKTFPGAFFGGIKDAIVYKSHNTIELLDELTEIAEVARKQGPLGLEKLEIEDPFLKKAIQMIADGYSADTLQHVLERERDLQYERLHMAHTCWAKFAEAGRAWA